MILSQMCIGAQQKNILQMYFATLVRTMVQRVAESSTAVQLFRRAFNARDQILASWVFKHLSNQQTVEKGSDSNKIIGALLREVSKTS